MEYVLRPGCDGLHPNPNYIVGNEEQSGNYLIGISRRLCEPVNFREERRNSRREPERSVFIDIEAVDEVGGENENEAGNEEPSCCEKFYKAIACCIFIIAIALGAFIAS